MDKFRLWLEGQYKWKVGPTGDREVVIDGVRIVVANVTRDVGRRQWNIGVVRDGRVDWVESGSTLPEVEEWIPTIVQNETPKSGPLG